MCRRRVRSAYRWSRMVTITETLVTATSILTSPRGAATDKNLLAPSSKSSGTIDQSRSSSTTASSAQSQSSMPASSTTTHASSAAPSSPAQSSGATTLSEVASWFSSNSHRAILGVCITLGVLVALAVGTYLGLLLRKRLREKQKARRIAAGDAAYATRQDLRMKSEKEQAITARMWDGLKEKTGVTLEKDHPAAGAGSMSRASAFHGGGMQAVPGARPREAILPRGAQPSAYSNHEQDYRGVSEVYLPPNPAAEQARQPYEQWADASPRQAQPAQTGRQSFPSTTTAPTVQTPGRTLRYPAAPPPRRERSPAPPAYQPHYF